MQHHYFIGWVVSEKEVVTPESDFAVQDSPNVLISTVLDRNSVLAKLAVQV
jgi:hypothetical protein